MDLGVMDLGVSGLGWRPLGLFAFLAGRFLGTCEEGLEVP